MEPNDPSVDDADGSQSAFYYFADALSILADTPENQCRRMGDHNVAWELHIDVLAGRYPYIKHVLTKEEELELAPLFRALDQLPRERLTSGLGQALNLAAMSHSAWVPIRRLATELLQRLQPAIERNRVALGLSAKQPNHRLERP